MMPAKASLNEEAPEAISCIAVLVESFIDVPSSVIASSIASAASAELNLNDSTKPCPLLTLSPRAIVALLASCFAAAI